MHDIGKHFLVNNGSYCIFPGNSWRDEALEMILKMAPMSESVDWLYRKKMIDGISHFKSSLTLDQCSITITY